MFWHMTGMFLDPTWCDIADDCYCDLWKSVISQKVTIDFAKLLIKNVIFEVIKNTVNKNFSFNTETVTGLLKNL
jgi:hypothetical protein